MNSKFLQLKTEFQSLDDDEKILFLNNFSEFNEFVENATKEFITNRAKEILKIKNDFFNKNINVQNLTFSPYYRRKYSENQEKFSITLCIYLNNKFLNYLYLDSNSFNKSWKEKLLLNLDLEKNKRKKKKEKKELSDKNKYLKLKERFG